MFTSYFCVWYLEKVLVQLLWPHGLQPAGFLCPWDFPARILEWMPFPSPGELPDPWIELISPALQTNSLPLSHQGRPESLYLFIVQRQAIGWVWKEPDHKKSSYIHIFRWRVGNWSWERGQGLVFSVRKWECSTKDKSRTTQDSKDMSTVSWSDRTKSKNQFLLNLHGHSRERAFAREWGKLGGLGLTWSNGHREALAEKYGPKENDSSHCRGSGTKVRFQAASQRTQAHLDSGLIL